MSLRSSTPMRRMARREMRPLQWGALVWLFFGVLAGAPANASEGKDGLPASTIQPAAPLLPGLQKGDHVVFLGGSNAGSVFEEARLGSLFNAAFPELGLEFSSLATPGDSLLTPARSPAELERELKAANASVVLAFYGTHEAAAGKAGMEKFRKALEGFIRSIKSQAGTPKGAPRLVLFGPFAREPLPPALQYAAASDESLTDYSRLMAEVAASSGVAFFDLHSATKGVLASGAQRSALLPRRWGAPQSALMVNGGLLTPEANRLLAPMLFRALTGREAPESGVVGKSHPSGSPKPAISIVAADTEREQGLPFKPAAGWDAVLYADRSRFPALGRALQMDWDAQGRLWVLCAGDRYQQCRIVVLEDTDADGRADRSTLFAGDLGAASSFACYRDGVLVRSGGDLWLFRDPAGTGAVTEKRRLVSGLAVPKDALEACPLQVDAKGGVLLHDEGGQRCGIETGLGAWPVRGGVYRFEPLTGRLEVLSDGMVPDCAASLMDPWSRDLNALGGRGPASIWKEASKGVRRPLLLEGAGVPDQWRGRLLAVSSASAFPVKSAVLKEAGGALKVEPAGDFASPNGVDFKSCALSFSPASSVYMAEDNADTGRIYRVFWMERKESAPTRVAGRSVSEMLPLLHSVEGSLLRQVRNEMATHSAAEVLPALMRWEAALDPKGAAYERLQLEALWMNRWFEADGKFQNRGLLEKVLNGGEARARAEAVRMVRESRRVLPGAVGLLQGAAGDQDALVRLEVLAAAAAFPAHDPASVGLVHRVLEKPTDARLEAQAKISLAKLEPDPGRMIVPKEPRVLKFVLGRLSVAELAKAPAVESVWEAQVDRPGMQDAVREIALLSLARARGTGRAAELWKAFVRSEGPGGGGAGHSEKLARLLLASPEAELRKIAEPLERAAFEAKSPVLRPLLQAALLRATPDLSVLWRRMDKRPERQVELLGALPLVKSTPVEAALHAVVSAILAAEPPPSEPVLAAAVGTLSQAVGGTPAEDFDLLAAQILKGRVVALAAKALGKIPEEGFGGVGGEQAQRLEPLVGALLDWLEAQPEGARGGADFPEALKTGRRLAERLGRLTGEPVRELKF